MWVWVLEGGVSWHSWLGLLGWVCVCVGQRWDGECASLRARLGVEVAVPLVREEEVVIKAGWLSSCLVGLDRFGGVVGW